MNVVPDRKAQLLRIFETPSIQLLCITGITVLCYFNTLYNDYSLDDNYITQNPYVLNGLAGLKDIWTHPYLVLQGYNIDYRPLSVSLFSIEFMVFGIRPFVSHFINLLLYVSTLILLHRVIIQVFKIDKIHPILPLLILVLFSVHPSHTEVVSSVKNRDELLSFLFILGTALFYNRAYEEKSERKMILSMLLAMLFFYLSMLSKMVSLPFMACLFLWSLYQQHYKNYKAFGTFLVVSAGMIAVHLWMFRDFFFQRIITISENPITASTPLDLRLGLGFNSLLYYFKFLFFPYPLRFYYGYNIIPFESVVNPGPLLGLILYGTCGALLVYSILKKRTYSFFLFAFLFCTLFYSNLFTRYTGIVSERSMYQFSFFFIAFFLLFLFQLRNSINKYVPMKYGPVVYLFFLLSFLFITIQRNMEWKNLYTLLFHDMPSLQNSSQANMITGYNCSSMSASLESQDEAASKEWAQKAISYYRSSLRVSPEMTVNYYLLGNIYRYGLKDFAEAEKNYTIAYARMPGIPGLSRQMAGLYFNAKEYAKAIPFYEKAAKEEPDNAELLFHQASNMYQANHMPEYLKLSDGLYKKFPETQYPYLNYATYFFSIHDSVQMSANLEKAIQFGCKDPMVFRTLIKYFAGQKNYSKAQYYKNLLPK